MTEAIHWRAQVRHQPSEDLKRYFADAVEPLLEGLQASGHIAGWDVALKRRETPQPLLEVRVTASPNYPVTPEALREQVVDAVQKALLPGSLGYSALEKAHLTVVVSPGPLDAFEAP